MREPERERIACVKEHIPFGIRLYNGQDIELYEFALQLMDARIAEKEAGFDARVRRFRQQNKRYQRWRRLKRVIGRITRAPYIGFAACGR